MKLTPALVSERCKERADEEKSLSFANQKITEVEDISFCVSLRRLDLSNNKIKTSSSISSLRHLPSLTWLDLSNNELTEIDGVCRIQTLNVLNVSKNKINMVSTRIMTMVNLLAFIASDNELSSLPSLPSNLDTLGKADEMMVFLSFIVVSRNRLEDLGLSFDKLPLLKKISASHNRIRSFPNISKCHSMKELRLNDNKIQNLGTLPLPSGLVILDLGKNCILSEEYRPHCRRFNSFLVVFPC